MQLFLTHEKDTFFHQFKGHAIFILKVKMIFFLAHFLRKEDVRIRPKKSCLFPVTLL